MRVLTRTLGKVSEDNRFCSVCSVLQCAAVCCSVWHQWGCQYKFSKHKLLQCVVVRCSVLQCVASIRMPVKKFQNQKCYSMLQCAAACCSSLQCVALCCSVLCRWGCSVKSQKSARYEYQTATQYNALHYIAPNRNTLHVTAPHCPAPPHTAAHYFPSKFFSLPNLLSKMIIDLTLAGKLRQTSASTAGIPK